MNKVSFDRFIESASYQELKDLVWMYLENYEEGIDLIMESEEFQDWLRRRLED